MSAHHHHHRNHHHGSNPTIPASAASANLKEGDDDGEQQQEEDVMNSSSTSTTWTVQIKTVGAQHQDFSIDVSPDEDVSSLFEKIGDVTGLSRHQQRLIYRGRLLADDDDNDDDDYVNDNDDNNETDADNDNDNDCYNNDKNKKNRRVKDIVGLTDGHTIHLVRKEQASSSSPQQQQRGSSSTPATTTTPDGESSAPPAVTEGSSGGGGPSGSATASLLAALLGMSTSTGSGGNGGGNNTTGNNNNSNNNNNVIDQRTRSRTPYRLSEADFVRPDPGNMESVRQGLLTLHTLLPNAATTNNSNNNRSNNPTTTTTTLRRQPRQRQPRRFYIGQWIDVRDTVNQWLEATIVDIVYPHEMFLEIQQQQPLLRGTSEEEEEENNSIITDGNEDTGPTTTMMVAATTAAPTTDPAVAVTDLEGRRRLLLEPCDDDVENDDNDNDEVVLEHWNGVPYRRRNNDRHVQLLHVHYNGWPVRWDEWIRSDSERIRPFRVRTRHGNNSSTTAPTVHATMPNPPSTRILANRPSESDDRHALLPELVRVSRQVHDLLECAARNNNPQTHPHDEYRDGFVIDPAHRPDQLPWEQQQDEHVADDDDEEEGSRNSRPSRRARRRELQSLAPLLDRLGRTLTDAAPHVAALAASIAAEEEEEARQRQEAAAAAAAAHEQQPLETIQEHPNSLGGLLSLLSRDRRRQGQSVSSNAAVPSINGDNVSASLASAEQTTVAEDDEDEDDEDTFVDPDHTDFATGFVNTIRGEVRNGPRSRRNEDMSNLLGAYLAAASLASEEEGGGGGEGLGRLLRGNGNGGIDIHIHAVVTAPGMEGADLPTATPVNDNNNTNGGLGNFLSLTEQSSPRRRGSRRSRSSNVTVASTASQSEDDMGIFAELYSENPDPVNPNSPDRAPSDQRDSNQNNVNNGVAESGDRHNDETPSATRSHSLRRIDNRNRSGSNSNSRRGVLGRFFRRTPE